MAKVQYIPPTKATNILQSTELKQRKSSRNSEKPKNLNLKFFRCIFS